MYYIGVDLGGTNIAIGLVNENHQIVKKASTPTLPERGSMPIVEDMARVSKELIAACNLTLKDIAYVGIASPGIANREAGIIEYSCNLPFRDFNIAEAFKSFLDVPRVYVENDANAAALAEALAGAAKGTKNSLMITLGTGVGGGIIIDGKIYSGANFAAGELGHTVIVAGGRLCSCGRRGCWETYSSATGLINMTKEKITELKTKGIPSVMITDSEAQGKVSARTAFEAMRQGDFYGSQIVDDYIFYLAQGLVDMINIFQPEVLSIGGGISNEKDYLLKPLARYIERDQYTRNSKKKCVIKIAQMGNDAGIIGAAGLGL